MEDPRLHRDFRRRAEPRLHAPVGWSKVLPRLLRAARRALVLAVGMSWFVAPARWYRRPAGWLPGGGRGEELAAIERGRRPARLAGGRGWVPAGSRPAGSWPTGHLPAPAADSCGTARAAPVVCAPQSYGPFDARLPPWIVAKTLRRARLVLAREDISLAELAKLRLPDGVAQRAVDSAFSLEPPRRYRADQLAWRAPTASARPMLLVGVTVRRRLPPGQQASHEAELAGFVTGCMISPVTVW